ncbi:AraC family transcriptional regulator [Paenibacillus sedimenti]|uniref:AraC family transcriptional regulator n=1 Tax=Paenibacillus sedimenti TaxID=2770274 RepID=A0A926KKV2_9BACL|nr:AraC family transcriptional regulator [Paenibacillus sedimenti]MBD0379515.1 AraC family transcriptional regulator [Paenibacillus sedimenti]
MHKYLLRLLGFTLILGALPTFLVGIASYYIATQDIEEKVNEGNMQLLQQTQMRVEQTLRSLEMSSLQFVNSSLVKGVMNESLTGEDFVQVRELTTELTNLQSKAVVNQAYLINLDKDWAVSLTGLKQVGSMDAKDQFLAYAKKPESIFWNTNSTEDAAIDLVSEPTETISLIYKIPLVPKTTAPKGILVVQISTSEIRGGLTTNNKLGDNYVLDKTGAAFLSSAQDKETYSEINRMIMERVSNPSQKQGFFKAKIGDSKLGVTYRSSGYNGWTFVSVVSIAEITKGSKKIGLFTAGVCALILLLVLIFAFYGSRRMYSPIRSLLEFTRKMGASQERVGTDEWTYLQDSLQSLFVSRSRLEKQMQGQATHLKEFFILKLFTGQISESDFLYRSRMYGFPMEWKRLGVLTLQIDNLQETRYQEQDRDLLLFAINNIVGELLPLQVRFSPILLNESQVTLLAVDLEQPQELKAYFYHTAERIKSSIEQYLQLQVSIGISRPFDKLSYTVTAYGESLAALKSRISLGPDIIVHYEDIEQNGNSETAVYAHLKVVEDQLIQALKDMQMTKAVDIFHQYLSSVLHKDGYLHEHHILFMQLMSRILLIVQDQGVSVTKVLDGENAIERFLKLQTREEISIWFQSRLFAPIVRILTEKADTQFLNIADRLVRMIHDQYDQDLTLESCATALNFHPVYLSRVFKKEMGVPFSDYLSEYRMNMAKEMLETTNLKISEIGEKLQYKNISAFIRTFRKTFGMTPGNYRELLENK